MCSSTMFKPSVYFFTIMFVGIFATWTKAETSVPGQGRKITENIAEYIPENIAIFDEENKKHFLEEYEGKTVLLVFWATWCAPCITEMADLDMLQKDFRKTNFFVLPLSEDPSGIETVKSFYKNHNLRYLPIMHDYQNVLYKSLVIAGLPTSILINSEGMAVAKFTGTINWYDEKVREILLKYIPGNPSTPRNSYQDSALNNVQTKPQEDNTKQETEKKNDKANTTIEDKENKNAK